MSFRAMTCAAVRQQELTWLFLHHFNMVVPELEEPRLGQHIKVYNEEDEHPSTCSQSVCPQHVLLKGCFDPLVRHFVISPQSMAELFWAAISLIQALLDYHGPSILP